MSKASNQPFDLIILDVKLPYLNGFASCFPETCSSPKLWFRSEYPNFLVNGVILAAKNSITNNAKSTLHQTVFCKLFVNCHGRFLRFALSQ